MRPTTILTAIAMIGVVTVYALSLGINGNVVYIAIIAIAGLGGFDMYVDKTGLGELLVEIKKLSEK